MRLFTAIMIPDEIKDKLQELFTPIEGVKWQSKSQMHLTLRFIGEVDEETADEVVDELRQVQIQPFDINLGHIGTFPESGKPKVIWIGIAPNKRLQELHGQLENACQDVGLEPDDRSFKPHITLGRNKSADPEKIIKYVDHQVVPDFDPIPVRDFCLFRSELTPRGAIYHIEKKYPLH